jgi:hypothetical protein
MTSILEQARAHLRQTGPRCRVCAYLATLPEPERDEWEEAMRERGSVTLVALAALMDERAEGTIRDYTLGRHIEQRHGR